MKIAIIPGAFFPNPGGAQVQAHNLANKLCEKNNKVDILIGTSAITLLVLTFKDSSSIRLNIAKDIDLIFLILPIPS